MTRCKRSADLESREQSVRLLFPFPRLDIRASLPSPRPALVPFHAAPTSPTSYIEPARLSRPPIVVRRSSSCPSLRPRNCSSQTAVFDAAPNRPPSFVGFSAAVFKLYSTCWLLFSWFCGCCPCRLRFLLLPHPCRHFSLDSHVLSARVQPSSPLRFPTRRFPTLHCSSADLSIPSKSTASLSPSKVDEL